MDAARKGAPRFLWSPHPKIPSTVTDRAKIERHDKLNRDHRSVTGRTDAQSFIDPCDARLIDKDSELGSRRRMIGSPSALHLPNNWEYDWLMK